MSNQKELCILIIEDYILDYELLLEMFPPNGYRTLNAQSLKKAKELIENNTIDLIILDLNIKDSNGIATYDHVSHLSPITPIIIVTGQDETELGILSVKKGAQDYLVKDDLDSKNLIRAIDYAIERNNLRIDLIAANKRIEDQKESLVSARIAAEKANRAKSEFIANMSHEIRTPLNAILGFTDILLQSIKDPKHLNFVKSIHASGKTLLTIMNDILDFSNIETGKMEIINEPVHVKKFVNDLQEIFSVSLQEKSLNLFIDIDKTLPDYLVLDGKRLRQILFNVVGNAVKFTNKGSITVFIEKMTSSHTAKKIDFKITVSDTGIGMEKNFYNHLFEPFSQFENTNTKTYKGIGLGLSLTHRLVTLLNGKISVTSQLNKGTTFTIILQDIIVSDKKDLKKKKPTNQPQTISIPNSKILVVDDIKVNRMVAKQFLLITKCKVIEAENGEQAVSFSKKYMPDIILMDIRMPKMDGIVAAKHIKNSEATRDIPIVALTASVLESEIRELKEGHFDDILQKPLRKPKLFEILIKYIIHKEHSDIEKPQNKKDAIKHENENHDHANKSSLKKTLLTKWEQVTQRQHIPEIEMFLEEIRQLAVNKNISQLNTFCEELAFDLDNFDIQKLKETLSRFPTFLNELPNE
ncbi:MAG: Hpt sensor hybrid histidine kinase [Candidatus Magnetoglobus multicellularis str. Araruama]|uniref:histidine kinase n=1 Tax=Candidatus Magnetoglobus multicellularis str. Araruama TaxID=890399 RepID=A0A1V1PGL3_9BACT|nr:MAG: Hpt sensor hybrid histidine kinase [Candidatus Magnetoglobus multicellularis str. Araruama]